MKSVTRSEAENYLRDIELDQWFDASVVIRPRGMARVPVNSLSALYILVEPNKQALPGIDFEELDDWLTRVIGDTELAAEVRSSDNGDNSFIDRCIHLYYCLHKRLRQYSEVLDEELVPEAALTVEAPTTNFAQHR